MKTSTEITFWLYGNKVGSPTTVCIFSSFALRLIRYLATVNNDQRPLSYFKNDRNRGRNRQENGTHGKSMLAASLAVLGFLLAGLSRRETLRFALVRGILLC